MTFRQVSILMPVYNEINTIGEIISQVKAADVNGLSKQLVIIDDGSSDGTREFLRGLDDEDCVTVFHSQNMGKGAAVRTALPYATGEVILIQDADLEYDPRDYPELIRPVVESRADVVYGTRLRGGKPSRAFLFWHYLGNKFLTFLTNLLYNTNLTDMETCYKVFRGDVIRNLQLRSNRFDFEPEITAKLFKRGHKVVEVPVSYYGRDISEGKKITWRDGLAGLCRLPRFRVMH